MARQKSIIKLKGTMGGISFYKTKDGYLAREKGGVDAERIANDPNFARTRENGAEFSNSASAGKLLRDAVRVLTMNASDSRVTSRLTRVMTQIKNLDDVNVRGERSVAVGIEKEEGKLMLKDFNFNIDALLGSVLYQAYQVDLLTGAITIESLVTQNQIKYPQGATHIIFRSGVAVVDFATGDFDLTTSLPTRLAIDTVPQPVELIPGGEISQMVGTKFLLLNIEFVQEMNGGDYSLNNGSCNTLAIIEVV